MDYKKLSIGLALVVAFLAGCLAHEVGVRPFPLAQAGAPVQHWQQMCREGDFNNVNLDIVHAGAEGWELVTATYERNFAWACFKRPAP